MASVRYCSICANPITVAIRRGPARRYCSGACRQRAYRNRAQQHGPASLTEAHVDRPLDSFVGRREELGTLVRLTRRGQRLLTLLGPAGAGKTRLALEHVTAHEGAASIVDLAAVGDGPFVGQAVAAALGIADEPGVPIADTITRTLHDRPFLLVLDNCERVAEQCRALVTTLLQRCANLQILATSREVLWVPGESVIPVGELDTADALTLFADRVSGTVATFALAPDNLPTVRAICERVDNLPLAIELVARLVRLLPLQDILQGLEDRFALLATGTGGNRRDLHAAIASSYESLDGNEQALFRRLAVLPGSFNLAMATELCTDLQLPVIELLSSLESRSLLKPLAWPTGQARFRQLASVRAYGQERLIESGELDAAAEHLVASLVEVVTPLTVGFRSAPDLLDRLCLEVDNLVAALAYLKGRSDGRETLLAAGLSWCRVQRGIHTDSRDLLESALQVPTAPTPAKALALERLAYVYGELGDHDAALTAARRAVDLTPAEQTDPGLRCRALHALAFVHQVRGELAQAQASYTAALRQLEQIDDHDSVALCRHNLAWVMLIRGDLDGAGDLLDAALPRYEHGDTPGVAAFQHTAGVLEMLRGDLAAADPHFAAAIRHIDENQPLLMAYALEGFAITAIRAGHDTRGLRLAGTAEAIRAGGVGTGEPWWHEKLTAAVNAARARLGRERADVAADHGRSAPLDLAVSYALRPPEGRTAPEAPLSPLSQREREVASLVADGFTNSDIAETLYISERTVATHLEHVRHKLDLRSRTHVAIWAARNLTGISP